MSERTPSAPTTTAESDYFFFFFAAFFFAIVELPRSSFFCPVSSVQEKLGGGKRPAPLFVPRGSYFFLVAFFLAAFFFAGIRGDPPFQSRSGHARIVANISGLNPPRILAVG